MGKRVSVGKRLEIRLDPEHRRKLEEVARSGELTVSEAVRRMIERAYGEEARARRMEAAREISRLDLEDVPDPETLSRQLEGAHESTDLR